MGWIITDATPADAEILSVLATEVWLDTYATDGVSPAHAAHLLREYSPAAFRTAMAAPDTSFFTCRDGTRILGYAKLLTAPDPIGPNYGTAELATLYVRRRHRLQGIGRALLRAALQRAATLGHLRLYLTVHHANHEAIGFYEAHHFARRGEWTFPFEGTGVRNLVYSVDLRPFRAGRRTGQGV